MVTKDMAIIEVLRLHPQVREILAQHGMGCIGCMGATHESIENGAKMHNIDLDDLLRELNELLNDK